MSCETWIRHSAWSAATAMVLLSGLLVQAASAQEPDSPNKPDTPPPADRTNEAHSYWLGVLCEEVRDPLRSHLELIEGQGLLIREIVKGGPADTAKLQVHDVLTGIGEEKLNSVEHLLELIADSGGQELSLNIIRGGKAITLAVTPSERPQEYAVLPPGLQGPLPQQIDDARFRKWLEDMWHRRGGPAGREFHILRPGVVERRTPKWPQGWAIVIEKSGQEPAKITVRHGQEKWESSEGDVDQLPAEIRPHVRRMLRPQEVGQAHFAPAGPQSPRAFPPDFKQQFEDLHRQLDELRKQMKSLQQPKNE